MRIPSKINFFEQILAFLDARMQTPKPYGFFHICWIVLVLAMCVLAFLYGKKCTKKCVNATMGITSALLILLEAYKQLNFSYTVATDSWAYLWYAFPFQFCSTPMYVMLVAACLRKGTLYNALCAYLATYALFAGLVVMVYPGDVFISTIGINVQTMVHHGAMVVIGVFLYASHSVKAQMKTLFRALPVFLTLSAVALTANVVFHFLSDGAQSFNMFFISPFETPTLVVFDKLFEYLPYPFYLATYILGFTLAAYITLLTAILCIRKKQPTRRKL